MGTIFTLDSGITDIIKDFMDDTIDELSLDCQLVYPPYYTACSNCVQDIVGIGSSFHWKSGGPMPFSGGAVCPMCGGSGKHANEIKEAVDLRCVFNPKDNPIKDINVQAPYGFLKTRGYLTDAPKVLRAVELMVALPIQPIIKGKYTRVGDITDPFTLVPGRYFVAFWKRVS